MTNIEKIIKQAVNEGIAAGRQLAEKKTTDAYKATERRLYALPDLKGKVEKDREYLKDLLQHGLQGHSKDIARFKRSGLRLSDEDLLDALAKDLQASILADEHEIKAIEDAIAPLTSDPYFPAVSGRYFDQKTDDEIAAEISCDPTTVRRNRGRLVRRVAIRLFGSQAV